MTPERSSGHLIADSANNSPLGRRRARAAAGSALFLVVAPGTMAVLIPYLLTGWDPGETPLPAKIAGAALIAAGAAALLHAFARFVTEGLGTPAPVAPTERLVITGLYRYVRNPMYLAVIACILGQAAILGRPVLVAYGSIIWAIVAGFVRLYEEPTLSSRFGDQYDAYRRAVRAWIPRTTPWRGDLE